MKTLSVFFLALAALAQNNNDYQISGIMVDHLTNRPLNHVLVEITRMGKPGGTASVLTEADGRFTFLHVPKGKYNLQAQKRGQFPVGYHSTDGGYATAIVVDSTLKTDGIIFALRTDASINGTIIGDDGEPVRNAQVQLFRESVNDGEPQTVQMNSATTSSSGQFHFGHLEPGKYYVSASGTPWYSQIGGNAPGTESVYPVTFYGDTTEGDAARSIVLTEGTSATIQIAMHAVPSIHVKLPNGHQNIMLAVPGPGGTQIPISASITGTTSNHDVSIVTSGQLMQQTGDATNATNWELVNIPAGHYEVMSYGQNGEQMQNYRTADLANGSTLSLDASSPLSEVNGRVIFDGPRPEGELNIFLSGGRRGMNATIAPDGSFKFDKLSAGTFDVNMNEMVITAIEAKGAHLVHDRVEIPPGGSVELTLHVQPSETLSSLEGVALQGETGMPGAMVLLIPQDLQRVRLIRRDQSDGDGSFSLPNVLPGKYTLLAIDDGHDLAYKDEKVIRPYLAGGTAITVPLKSSEPLKINVQTRSP